MNNMRKTIGTAACILAGISAGAPLAAVGGAGSAANAAGSVIHFSSTDVKASPTKVDASSLSEVSGARKQWKANFTGAGVDVAVIDSGVTPVDGLSAPGKVVYGPDFTLDNADDTTRNLDVFGHGTHISGIIAGRDDEVTGPPMNDTTHFMGVAPDSRILSVKVANPDGTTSAQQVVAALNWVTDHRNDNGLHVRVVNLSLGSDSSDSYRRDQLAGAVERAWKAGLVVVVAGGNDGWYSAGLNNPAFDPYIIAVGAADTQAVTDNTDDAVASFSSAGDGNRNPDVTAPGAGIQSLRVPGSVIDQVAPPADGADPRFVRGNGSSQATGVVSGQIALMLQARPTLTPDQVKYLLAKTAIPLKWKTAFGSGTWPATLQGNGEVDLNNAMHTNPPKTGVTQTWKASKYDNSDVTTVDLDTSGVRWSGVRWNGVRWSGVRWSGVRWSGADWS